MNFREFESYLASLDEPAYAALVQERIARLDTEQQALAQVREAKRKEVGLLIAKLKSDDPEVHQQVFDALRDSEEFECEHGRSYVKHCIACAQIDHLMWPELFDKNGYHLGEEE